jgi:hypothetical protein
MDGQIDHCEIKTANELAQIKIKSSISIIKKQTVDNMYIKFDQYGLVLELE